MFGFAKVSVGATKCLLCSQALKLSHNIRCSRFNSLRGNVVFSNNQKVAHKEQWTSLTFKRFFRQSRSSGRLTPGKEIEDPALKGVRALWKPLGFTILVTGVSFTGASIWQYESLRKKIHSSGYSNFQNKFYQKAGSFRRQFNQIWNSYGPVERAALVIIGLNAGVFVLWKIPPLTNTMMKYFMSSPMRDRRCWPMLLSTFSHNSALHLAANMFVFWSFIPPIATVMGKEEFTSFFISAGVISSFTGYMYKVARGLAVPSIGASGAIIAVLGVSCSKYPDQRLSVIGIGEIYPHSFSAASGMKALILLDTLGILLRWKLFDHAAHLGGMFFGIWYATYGQKLYRKSREPLLKWWHERRNGQS